MIMTVQMYSFSEGACSSRSFLGHAHGGMREYSVRHKAEHAKKIKKRKKTSSSHVSLLH